jgi:hypothetical protein
MDCNHIIHLDISGDREMKKILVFVLLSLLLVSLSACAAGQKMNLDKSNSEIKFTAPGPNPELNKPSENKSVAGLGMGFWHGLISPVTLIMSFLNPVTQMYEVYNNGAMYNLGFLLGVALVFLLLGFFGGRRH